MYIELLEEQNVCYSTTPTLKMNFDDLIESDNNLDSDLLYVPAEGIHSIITGNYTYYEPTCIEESVPLWTYPYNIPIIFHHKEHDSQIIGRVKKAEYIKLSKRTKTPALKFIFGIGDKDGKEGIQNGTLSTISIGAKAVDLRCSVCGRNLVKDGFCEHERGKTYDDKLCYWIVKKIVPKEVSYVIVPSDKYAYSEAPLSGKDVISISESIKDNEVKDLANKNLFHDYYSAALAEAQERALTEDENNLEDKDTVDVKPEENKDKEPKKEEKENGSEEKKDEQKQEDKCNVDIKDEAVKSFVSELQNKIKELEKEVELFKDKYKEADKLRESAEKRMLLIESSQKEELANKINDLRTSLGLTEKDHGLLIKSDIQMLTNDLNTLKELSSSTINSIKTVEKLQSTSLVNEKLDNTSKKSNLKESEDTIRLNDKMNKFFKR